VPQWLNTQVDARHRIISGGLGPTKCVGELELELGVGVGEVEGWSFEKGDEQ
jgi:hypothetical protein